ncbi:serine/arginine-rich SC35-like splicing factor SCL33 isoform X2 [Vitis vinifera]|uniref:serine/arginine-rich SC35-like splicing factor SCL33 isoform X2 n=1 Tax=Vitis vinifera TaxID=29760 RepID=UPI0028832776|nr:serine/arginine-rich SC35-like splicing factor SCL33 isoform X2 [Vitis vinifera]
MRGRSYSPSPPRGYSRRGRSPSPRGRHGGRGRDLPTSLLVRNLRHDCRPEDLRRPFGQFGPLKDIYLPRDYYTGEPRGFGFVQYVDPADAAEAKYQMDGQVLLGRELTVVFAEENRKRPVDMRARERTRGRPSDRRRSPPRYSRSPRYARSRSRSPNHYPPSPRRRHYSRYLIKIPISIMVLFFIFSIIVFHWDRSVSPQDKRRYSGEQPYSASPPVKGSKSQSRSPSRSRSQTPVDYSRGLDRERSLSQ